MTMRTHRKTFVLNGPFLLKGVESVFPPGGYDVVTDDELIEGLSFPIHQAAQNRDTPGRELSMTEANQPGGGTRSGPGQGRTP